MHVILLENHAKINNSICMLLSNVKEYINLFKWYYGN